MSPNEWTIMNHSRSKDESILVECTVIKELASRKQREWKHKGMGFDYGTVYPTLCLGFSEIGYRIHGCGTSNADRYMDPKTRQLFLSIRCAACATNDLGYVCPYRPSPKETLVLDSSIRINSFSRSCTITRAYESISPQHTQML